MSIRRIVTSISSHFEELVNKVENHEAVAECAIADARQYTAKLNAQLQVNRTRNKQLVEREADLELQCQRWRSRARDCAESDREKALRCMQALKTCEQQKKQIAAQREQNESLGCELQTHLHEAEQKLLELQHRKSSLSARAARNNVVKAARREAADGESSDEVFLRWEEKVLADEYAHVALQNPSQDLASSFEMEENRMALEAELDHLLADRNHPEGEIK